MAQPYFTPESVQGNKRDGPGKPPPFKAIPFTSIGLLSRDVLHGSRSSGVFLIDHQARFSTKTAGGTAVTAQASRNGSNVSTIVTGSHVLGNGVSLAVAATDKGAADIDITAPVGRGFSLSHMSIIAPGPVTAKGAITNKLGADFVNEHVNLRATATTDTLPRIHLSLGTSVGGLQLGGDVNYSTALAWECARDAAAKADRKLQAGTTGIPSKGSAASSSSGSASRSGISASAYRTSAFDTAAILGGLTRWTVAMGWDQQGHNVALSLSDPGAAPLQLAAKLSYAYTIQEGVNLAAEATRDIPIQAKIDQVTPISFSVGLAAKVGSLARAAKDAADRRDDDRNQQPEDGTARAIADDLISSQALVKVKVDNTGMITWSAQINMKDPFLRYPRLGVALELV